MSPGLYSDQVRLKLWLNRTTGAASSDFGLCVPPLVLGPEVLKPWNPERRKVKVQGIKTRCQSVNSNRKPAKRVALKSVAAKVGHKTL
jgi:hypothetical protein